MKKFVAAMLICLIMVACFVAHAETRTYGYMLLPTTNPLHYDYGTVAQKADNEQRYYVTQNQCTYPDHPIYYRPVYPDGSGLNEVGEIMVMTGNHAKRASYIKTVSKDDEYALAAVTPLLSGISGAVNVAGRWTP